MGKVRLSSVSYVSKNTYPQAVKLSVFQVTVVIIPLFLCDLFVTTQRPCPVFWPRLWKSGHKSGQVLFTGSGIFPVQSMFFMYKILNIKKRDTGSFKNIPWPALLEGGVQLSTFGRGVRLARARRSRSRSEWEKSASKNGQLDTLSVEIAFTSAYRLMGVSTFSASINKPAGQSVFGCPLLHPKNGHCVQKTDTLLVYAGSEVFLKNGHGWVVAACYVESLYWLVYAV